MNPTKRAALIARLVPLIDAALTRDADMRREAIVEGRIGLNEMDDGALEDFALDCYEIDALDMCDACGAANNDGEGENGLCGNCADHQHNETNLES